MEWLDYLKSLFDQGVLGILVGLGLLFIWKKVIPWLERYIASVEKLHDSIGEKMGTQQAICVQHGEAIGAHDAAMREAALEAFRFVQVFVKREFPNSAADADEAFDKLKGIMGE